MRRSEAAERLARMVEREGAESKRTGLEAEQGLIETYTRVAGGFDAGPEPVDRIIAKAAGHTATAKRPHPKPRRRPPRAAIVAGLVFLVIAVAVIAQPAAPSSRTVVANALAAVELQGEGVLYIKAVKEYYGPKSESLVDELWMDYKNGHFRRLERAGDGVVEDDLVIDLVLSQYAPDSNMVTVSGLINQIPNPGPAWMFSERENLAQTLRNLLKTDRASMTEEEIDGQKTFRIEFDPRRAWRDDPPAGGARAKPEQASDKIVVNVDKESFLPLKVTTFHLEADEWKLTSRKTYEQIRWVTAAALPANIFSQSLPSDVRTETMGPMNLKMAKAYTGLKLYYLGSRFQRLPLSEISDLKRREDFAGPRYVKIWYREDPGALDPAGDSGDVPTLTIDHITAGSMRADPRVGRREQLTERLVESVQISSRRAELTAWTAEEDGRRFASAVFVDGDTEVRISAEDGVERPFEIAPKEIVLEALHEIELLN